MPRIAILFEYSSVNGGENSILAVLQHLLRKDGHRNGIEFVALTSKNGRLADRLKELLIPIVDFNLVDSSGARMRREAAVNRLLHIVADCKADLVHANSLAMGRLTGAAVNAGLTVPTTAHIRDIMKVSRKAIDDLNRNQRLVAVSNATIQFHRSQGLSESQSRVIYNGIDPGDFRAAREARARVRAALKIPNAAKVALTVGQIGLRKGLDTLASAACSLAASQPDIHWLLIGERFSNKAESVQFERDVIGTFSRAEPRLHFHNPGYRMDVPDLMAASDVLVHAARQEPFGRVLLEAASARLPIVATSVGGTPEMLGDQKQALLVPPDQPKTLADAVARILSDPGFADELSGAAKSHVLRTFPIERTAKELTDLWHAVLFERLNGMTN